MYKWKTLTPTWLKFKYEKFKNRIIVQYIEILVLNTKNQNKNFFN